MDIQLKDEVKILKEKLKKKTSRIKELIKKNEQLKKSKDYFRKESHLENERLWAIRRYFPDKYYRVEWSGVNALGNRNPPVIELKKGLCAADVIFEIKESYTKAKIHMIEEVAS